MVVAGPVCSVGDVGGGDAAVQFGGAALGGVCVAEGACRAGGALNGGGGALTGGDLASGDDETGVDASHLVSFVHACHVPSCHVQSCHVPCQPVAPHDGPGGGCGGDFAGAAVVVGTVGGTAAEGGGGPEGVCCRSLAGGTGCGRVAVQAAVASRPSPDKNRMLALMPKALCTLASRRPVWPLLMFHGDVPGEILCCVEWERFCGSCSGVVMD